MYYHNKSSINTSSGNLNNCLPVQSYSAGQLMAGRQSQPQLNQQTPLSQPSQSYNYNHWLIQEAEYRRQMASRGGSSLIASTKNQPQVSQQPPPPNNNGNQMIGKTSSTNVYKDDQPVYENTIIYNSHKKQLQQQQLSTNMPYLGNQQQQQQINKPPYPNPTMISGNQSMISSNPTMMSSNPTMMSSNPTMMSSNQSTSLIHHNSPINGASNQPQNYLSQQQQQQQQQQKQQKQILSVSGKKKCSNCGDELGKLIELQSLKLNFIEISEISTTKKTYSLSLPPSKVAAVLQWWSKHCHFTIILIALGVRCVI